MKLLAPQPPVLKGLLVGPPGSGKTSLLATAADVPGMSPVCIIDLEGGTLSVAHRGDIFVERIKTSAELERVHNQIVSRRDGHEDIKTYIIDSGSEFAELVLEETAATAFERACRNPNLAQRSSPDDVQLKDYAHATKRVRRLFRWFKDLDQHHVLFTALDQAKFPPEPGNLSEAERRKRQQAIDLGLIRPIEIVPAFPAKLSMAITGFVDFAWYLNLEEQGRRLVTSPAGPLRWVKTRGVLADVVGASLTVDFVDGKPVVENEPVMRYIYTRLLAAVGMNKGGEK